MTHSENILAHTVLYIERFGLSVIPMSEEKRPVIAWKEYQTRKPTIEEVLSWSHINLAIVTGAVSGICVIDCESRDDAVWFHRTHGGSSVVTKTKRGYHFYFRHPGERVKNGVRINDRYDVRGDGGYVLAPPSKHSEGCYQWVHPLKSVEELPYFKMEWRPETREEASYEKIIHDGVKYISNIKAVSGQAGHNETFRAACCLRDSGMGEAEALLALQSWNQTNADPPWSDRELLHKIREAYR